MSEPPTLEPMPAHTHVVSNGKRDLTIDELARQQPGMDRLMAEVGPRVHRMYYAARAGNWPLAAYFAKSAAKQLQLSVDSRPKYDPAMTDYLSTDWAPVAAAIKARDGVAFELTYQQMVLRANELHVEFGKAFLVWRTPGQAPDDLDLTAGMEQV